MNTMLYMRNALESGAGNFGETNAPVNIFGETMVAIIKFKYDYKNVNYVWTMFYPLMIRTPLNTCSSDSQPFWVDSPLDAHLITYPPLPSNHHQHCPVSLICPAGTNYHFQHTPLYCSLVIMVKPVIALLSDPV